MTKLSKFKEVHTPVEAAKYLTVKHGEPFTVADVLQLGLDKHLTLSVFFADRMIAQRGKVVRCTAQQIADMEKTYTHAEDLDWEVDVDALYAAYVANVPPPAPWPKAVCSPRLDDGRWITFREEKVVSVSGLLDLAMIGNERKFIQAQFQALTGVPAISLPGIDGTYLVGDGDIAYSLLTLDGKHTWRSFIRRPFHDYAGADGLPSDTLLVIRTAALEALDALLTAPGKLAGAAELKPREKDSLLILIAAMCKALGINWKIPGAAKKLEAFTELTPVKISEETIKNKIIDHIQDALDRRSKP